MKKNRLLYLFSLIIIALVLYAYAPAFKAGFTNWDDPAYVVDNDIIKDINGNNINLMFSEFKNGHYHPLTWISLAVDYSLTQGDAGTFHRTNIILHLLNSLLVFIFLLLLLKKEWLAFCVTLIFSVHPMSVEAVAWVSERKTVLYVFFMMLSLIAYLLFSDRQKKWYYFISLLMFLLACLSKSMAVVLPVILVFIDYIKEKELTKFNTWKNKIPFIIIAAVFGIVSVFAQKQVIQPEHIQEIQHSAGWGAWSFVVYLIKMIFPAGLSAFYPYPPDGSIGISMIITGFIVLIAFIYEIFYFHKKGNKTAVFGLVFLFANIFFVLKFFTIPASAYYMADRYAYLPAAGLWLVLFLLTTRLLKKEQYSRILFILISLVFVISANARAKTWKNSITLWSDVIEKHDEATVAFINRGNAYRDNNNYDKAIKDYNDAEKINPRYTAIYTNRGYANYMSGRYKEAVSDFSKSLMMNHDQTEVLYNRGLAFYSLKDYDKALEDYSTVLKTDPSFKKAITGKGNVFAAKGNDSLAIEAYTSVILADKNENEAYYNRANILAKNGKYKEALEDYNHAIETTGFNSDYYVNRASTYYYLNEFEKALNDFNTVISKNPSHTNARMNRGTLALRMGNYQMAFDDFSDVIKREPKNAEAYLKRGMTILNSNKPTDACKDFAEAYKLGNSLALNFLGTYCR